MAILTILTILTIVAAVTVVTSGRDWFRQIRRFSPASAVLQESQKNKISLNIKYTWSGPSVKSVFGLPPLAKIWSTTGVSQYTVRSKSQSVTNKFIVKYTEMVFVPSVLKMFPFGTPGQSFISAYAIMQNHCKCCTLEKSKTLQHGGKVDSVTASFNSLKSVE